MTKYADLADLPENDRIRAIGELAMKGEVVGFVVETNGKANRYLKKLRKKFPKVVEIERKLDVPFKGVVFVRVALAEKGN